MAKLNIYTECHGYNVVIGRETEFIKRYFLEYDVEPIAKLLQSDFNMSADMRRFVADILTGKIKKKKPSEYSRNLKIYREYQEIKHKYPKKPLRDNRDEQGIAAILAEKFNAEKFNIKEETIINAKKNIEKKRDKDGCLSYTDEHDGFTGWELAPPKDFEDILFILDEKDCEWLMKNQPTDITFGNTTFHIENNTATEIRRKRK